MISFSFRDLFQVAAGPKGQKDTCPPLNVHATKKFDAIIILHFFV